MCGLVGIWRHDGRKADRSAIALMLEPIGHRGPDGIGIWQDGQVAFGHRRLAILDLTESSSQPILTADSTGVLIYNGEIYNYRQLREELETEGIRFRSSGDTEVVLQALHHWGPERSVIRFNGMFAFAYFDRRSRTLWLARDKVGIKPLLIANTGTELLFASEAKALLAHPRLKPRVDRHAIAKLILASGSASYRMPFEGIDEIRPGSWYKISEHEIEQHQYFHALTAVDLDRLVSASAKNPVNFVGEFREHLSQSVCLHLASDVPLAAMCSGGVDSSLIAAYTKEKMPDLRGYVADVTWPGGEGDQAERVGKHLGIPIRRVVVDRALFLNLWPHTVWHSDGPPTHPSDTALLAVAQTCRADGVKVLLTGEGSDELFGGYRWQQTTYDDWRRLSSWRRYFLPEGASRKALAWAPFATMIARADPKLRRRLTIALDAEVELLPRQFWDLLAPIKSQADRAFIAHNLCSLYHHLSWILHRHDRIGMAASIEMRVPFLENGMFDFAFHLPRGAKLHRGVGKWVVKKAAAEILPADIVYAVKKGFPMPKEFSLGTQHLLVGGVLQELLKWPANVTQEIATWLGKDGSLRFRVVGLELWARIFFRGERPVVLGEQLNALADATARGHAPNRRRGSRVARVVQRTFSRI
jgi:asparagine synthase (glutamine-hydrolysing)